MIKEAFELAADAGARNQRQMNSDPDIQAEIVYRTIGDIVPDFVWSCSSNGSPLYVNERWTEYTGMTLFDNVPMDVYHHPDDLPSVEQKIKQSIANGGEQFEAEFRLCRKDGVYRWVSTCVSPVKDKRGGIVQWVGVTTDIHERKLTELSLSQSHSRLQQIIETALDAIVSLNAAGEITEWNSRAEEMFGWQREEAIGLTFFDSMVSQNDRHALKDGLRRLLDSADGRLLKKRFEVSALHRSGREFPVEVSICLIRVEGQYRYSAFIRDLSERRQIEADLGLSHQRFRATFEHSAVGFAHLDINGRWLRVNDKLCEMLGYPREELLSLRFDDVMCSDDDTTGLPATLLAGEVGACKFEKRFVSKRGQIQWATVTASGILDTKSNLDYVSCVIQDITDYKKAVYALTKSLRILATAEQIAGTGGWEYDVHSGTISRSDELCRMIGVPMAVTPHSIDTVFELVHPDDRDRLAGSLESAIKDCKAYVCKYRLLRPDGREIVLSARGEPVSDESGKVVRVVGSTQDITATEEADRILDQRRRMLLMSGDLGLALTPNHSLNKSLRLCTDSLVKHLDSAIAIVWTIDSSANRFDLVAMSERNPRSSVDKTSVKQLAEIYLDQVARERKLYVTNALLDDPALIEYSWIRHESVTAFACLPLTVNDILVGVLALFTRNTLTNIYLEALNSAADIMAVGIQRRNAEERLRKLNLELEIAVAERTAQLQAAHKELDDFTYSVAHELRAPLRGIDGFSLAVINECKSDLPEQATIYLNRVRNSVQRMRRLIDDLLHLSYLGKQPLNMQSVNLNPIVEEVVSEFRIQYGHRRVEIGVADLPICRCDPYLIQQVIANLLSNSFKYTGPVSPAKIEVGCIRKSETNIIYVRDNGVGFEMQYANKLFDAFQRLHRTEEFEGNGIGLAIVDRIVNRHGGTVWAESRPGEGATFFISLKGPIQ
jgi:PAS domain S-box-containing protein